MLVCYCRDLIINEDLTLVIEYVCVCVNKMIKRTPNLTIPFIAIQIDLLVWY